MVSEPGTDGVFRHVDGLLRFLSAQGHELHFAYSSQRSSRGLRQLVAFVGERGGYCIDLHVGNAPQLGDLRALLQLRAFAANLRPDIIHAHSSKAGALARVVALLGVPAHYFYTPHAYYGLSALPGLRTRFFNLIERILGRIGTTLNISADEAAFARESLGVAPEKQRIIHNPVSELFFTPRTEMIKSQARIALDLPQKAIVLGTVGRMAEQKDPATLYKAFSRVLAEFPDLLFVHLGDGPLQPEIERRLDELDIAKNVRLLKYRDAPIVVYQALDILVMSSRYEAGWPISILEAMAQNLPIVTTLCPGCHNIGDDILSHCWTAPTGAPNALADAIRACLADRINSRRCNHRQIAQERFTVKRCYGAVVAAYRQEK